MLFRSLLKTKTKTVSPEEQKTAMQFWEAVSKNIPEWSLLVDKKVSPVELRREYVHSFTNILNALGLVGNVLIKKYPEEWKSKLKGLQKIDWARDNEEWQGKVIVDGRMLKQKAGINKAALVILEKCGVNVTLDSFSKET